jgi:predicted  nucleic acid-binding Zn-ribbon protein
MLIGALEEKLKSERQSSQELMNRFDLEKAELVKKIDALKDERSELKDKLDVVKSEKLKLTDQVS